VHWLEWHYRSKHESLIAFSNRRFYENRLFTFPSSAERHPRLGVEFIHVPDGVYDRGGRRDNEREADVVVERIVHHFLETPERSLGVVAFSVAQQRAIEDRLELYRKQHPETDQYFDEDRLEGFFVKNLETVQGDERDVIIFSIGYGRDRNGEFKMFLGPLNYEGGERRLNVAVTRAREKVLVASSVRAADFDLRGTTAAGVLALHRYLDYAERGLPALETPLAAAAGEPQSPLEESVAGVIRELGYDVSYQVGCSKYRVDLGVIDPAQPGRFILGVECDGAMYHSAYTARDRDRIRQEVLERLGWRIHRVWSPDWTTRHDVERARLREAIERSRLATPTPLEPSTARPTHAVLRTVEPAPVAKSDDEPPTWAVPYQAAELTWSQSVDLQVARVVELEGPVHIEVLQRRVAQGMGYEKTGSRVRESITAAVRQLTRRNKVRTVGDFLWPVGDGFELKVRYPDGGETRRRIEHIAIDELSLAMLLKVHEALSLAEEDLMVQVARLFGFERRGWIVDSTLRQVLESLVAKGLLRRGAGRVSLSPKAKRN
jgi:very-short-patch-repair endonuclease